MADDGSLLRNPACRRDDIPAAAANHRKRKNPADNINYFEVDNDGEIKVQISSVKTISLKVKGSDTIGSIKVKIHAAERIPFDQQELTFEGAIPRDINTLANWGMKKDSTLILIRKTSVFMNIFIKDSKGKTHSLQVKPSDTIGSVKKHIACPDHALFYNGIVLEDSGTLAYFRIHNGSNLTCIDKLTKTMEISVSIFTGKLISLSVSPTNTIADLKLKISDMEGIDVDKQVLIFNGMVLDDNATIFDLEINWTSTLKLMRKSSPLMKIFIKTHRGETITLEVKPLDTISNIKAKIQEKIHIPHDEQALIFNEMVLDNIDTLADFNIKKEATLTLMRISTGHMNIFINLASRKTIVMKVKPSDTIYNVKSKILEKEGIPHNQQRLEYFGKALDDQPTLADYGVRKESTIHCFTALRA